MVAPLFAVGQSVVHHDPMFDPSVGKQCGKEELDKKDITGCTSLLHLKHLGHREAVWLGDALHHNPDLEFLDLHHTRIGTDDAVSLAAGLENNTKLKRLAMHNNYAYDAGAVAFGRALLTNDALEFLSLSTNGIGDEGAIALAEGLKGNKALRRLDLYFNQISDKGSKAFAEALAVNRGLNTLHLDTNAIGEEGGLAFARAIAGEPATLLSAEVPKAFIGELTIMFNQLTNKAADAIMDAAMDNYHLHNVALDSNHQMHGDAKERWKEQHRPTFAERHKIATWLVETKLVGSSHDFFDGMHHNDDGPPLASPYAPVVEKMKLHTADGLEALRHEDEATLRARAEMAGLAEAERDALVKVILGQVAKATSHDEL